MVVIDIGSETVQHWVSGTSEFSWSLSTRINFLIPSTTHQCVLIQKLCFLLIIYISLTRGIFCTVPDVDTTRSVARDCTARGCPQLCHAPPYNYLVQNLTFTLKICQHESAKLQTMSHLSPFSFQLKLNGVLP